MDAFARSLITADKIISNSEYSKLRRERYASFDEGEGSRFENRELTLELLAEIGHSQGTIPQISGRQEYFENIINQYL